MPTALGQYDAKNLRAVYSIGRTVTTLNDGERLFRVAIRAAR